MARRRIISSEQLVSEEALHGNKNTKWEGFILGGSSENIDFLFAAGDVSSGDHKRSVCRGDLDGKTAEAAQYYAGKVPKPAFPLCGSLVVDFSEVWNCTSVDNLGTQFLNTSLTFTEAFQYKDGYVLDFPVAPNVGRSRLILHLK
jgi:hypothetical protein